MELGVQAEFSVESKCVIAFLYVFYSKQKSQSNLAPELDIFYYCGVGQ